MNEQALKKDIANNITFVFQTLLPENTGTDRASPMASRIVPGKRKLIPYSGVREPEVLQKAEFVTPYDVIQTGIEDFVAAFYQSIPITTVPGLENALTIGLKQSEERLVQTLTTQLKKDVAAQKQTSAILDSLFARTDKESEKREKDLLNISAQWLKNLILWNCRKKGYKRYQVVTEGDNCKACTKMDGAVFPIVQAEPGKTAAPFHPNCNCKTAILNQNNEIAFFADDIAAKLLQAFDFSKPWEQNPSENRITSVSEAEAVYLAKLQSIGISFSLALEILAEMRRTGGNVSKEQFDRWGFADSFSRGYAQLQYKMVSEGMTVEQYEFLTGNMQLSALIDITFYQLALSVVNVTDGKFFKDKAGAVAENPPFDQLNWDKIISKKGETRIDHIQKHSVPNPQRLSHGVFNGNAKAIIDNAWKNKGNIIPIDDEMGGQIYHIPYQNAGYESGSKNTGAQMNYVTIIVMDGTNDLITAFPSFGNYK